ncbi:MAG: PAS domain-containing protein [Albidovulum sp.]
MDFPAILEVRAYWEALRNGRPMPTRTEIDPRGIEHALEFAFILERIAPKVARFRLSGRHLNNLMGMDVRGMPITTFFVPDAREKVSDIVEAVFTNPETAEIELAAEQGFGKPPIRAKLLMLPLQGDASEPGKALGCLVSIGDIGRTPRRFHLGTVRGSQISKETSPKSRHQPATGFAESAREFDRSPTLGSRGRAHLRLVKTED